MGKPRDTNKYRLWKGGKLVPDHPYGITDDLKRRQTELRRDYPGAQIEKVGNKTTREAALDWERKQYKRRGR